VNKKFSIILDFILGIHNLSRGKLLHINENEINGEVVADKECKGDNDKLTEECVMYKKRIIKDGELHQPVIAGNIVVGVIIIQEYDENVSPAIMDPYVYLLTDLFTRRSLHYDPRDKFMANMSHEIRTPLNGIVGYTQLLSKTNMDSTQRNYLKYMNKCCLHLTHIINDLLDYAKLNSGRMEVKISCWNTQEIIHSVKNTLIDRLKEKNQTLQISFQKDMPLFIMIDKNKVIQILVNLVSNAIKFSYSNSEIIVDVKQQDGNVLQIDITDQGIGIKPDDLSKLFSSFTQLDNSTTKSYEGVGLGLAISKKLSELLKGKLTVKSEYGKGSTFTLTVPFISIDEQEKNLNTSIFRNGFTVLVVDDNSDNRVLLCSTLIEWGITPLLCSSAIEAMSYVNSKLTNIDVALLDICMPDISGNDLATCLRDKNPELPLIAISSVDEVYVESDFVAKLVKPIHKIQLYESLKNILSSSPRFNKSTLSDIKTPEPDSPREKTRVLLAEDVDYNQEMLEQMLFNIGYKNITKVSNGRDVIKKLETEKYDILLLDIKMPIMDGYAVLKYIKENVFENLKIICITASTSENSIQKCSSLGCDNVITKPVNLHTLSTFIKKVLNV